MLHVWWVVCPFCFFFTFNSVCAHVTLPQSNTTGSNWCWWITASFKKNSALIQIEQFVAKTSLETVLVGLKQPRLKCDWSHTSLSQKGALNWRYKFLLSIYSSLYNENKESKATQVQLKQYYKSSILNIKANKRRGSIHKGYYNTASLTQ